jgi:coenzyme F420 hydrogenase subunit beta
LHALKNGLVDAAIVSSWAKNRPFYPVPVLASTTDQILKSAGTRYSYSPNLLALCEVAKPKTSKIAFVGIPCQIRSIRKMQALGLNKIVKPVKYLLGLMCSESFSYEGLMKRYIGGQQGIKLNQIAKLNIKGKLIVTTKSGTVITTPLSEIKKYRERGCTFCQDFSSELADISVGGLGLRGWTFTIIRTQAGEELFSSAEEASQVEVKSVGDNEAALNLLRRLSCKKRETTQASMS